MFTEDQFNTGEVVLNYAEGPAVGPALVLLHGGSARWQAFLGLMPELAQQWHVYALDLRGHGKSGWTPGRYRLEDYEADLIAFLRGRLNEPAILWGHSLGGVIALMLAADYPDRVRAVIAGDPPLDMVGLHQHLRRQRQMTMVWRELSGGQRPVEQIAAELRHSLIPVPGQAEPVRAAEVMGEDNPWFEYMAECLYQHDPSILTAVIDEAEVTFGGFDFPALLPRLSCPVLFIQGNPELGGLSGQAEIDLALSRLPLARHARIEETGHSLHESEPVLRAANRFLAEFAAETSK